MKKLNKRKIISLTKIIPPFLMVDNINNIINLKSSTGVKKVNKNSWFFKCHLTDQPMMPGVLLEEAMLQTIVATLYSSTKFKDKVRLLAISHKTNLYSKVDKPTILKIDIKILKIKKTKIESRAIITNHKNIKIASGDYNHFISIK